jgi:sugar O-acyltransferase (sialic acid O-acetyltransferase NeuD family)
MDVALGVKYGVDRVAAFLLLLVLAPFLAVIAVCIRLDSPGGPFFLQERIGAGGRPFTIFKFRTMRHAATAEGLGQTTAADDDRITRVGRWLRATSLDELPQILNIVLGEMSFIGPRPTLRYQVERYTPRQRRRLLFRPGITGWAQVHGRNEIPWEQRIEYDIQYVERFSWWLDLRVAWRTLGVLLRRDGVYAAGGNDTFGGVPEPGPVVQSGAEDHAPGLLPLLVVGAGGHARVLLDIAEKQGRYRVVGLLDDRAAMRGTTILGYPVLGGREVLETDAAPAHAVVAIGAAAARAQWQEHLEARGFQLAVLVHPAAEVGRDVQIGAGSVLMAGAIVNSGTRLGRGVIVNTGASIDHDCDIGAFAHIAPGARLAGGVRAGERVHIGIGSCVIQNRRLGADAVVGAGAAVVRDVAASTTVVGVPARPLVAAAAAAPPAVEVANA